MYEYEFRLSVTFPEKKDLYAIISSFPNVKRYVVSYLKSFRFKDKKWELKTPVSQVAVYYDGLWFKFVVSKESKFSLFGVKKHKQFYETFGFYQGPLIFEYRYEIKLKSRKARLYAFERLDNRYGLVFEYEICVRKKKLKNLPIDTTVLQNFKHLFPFFHAGMSMPYILKTPTRKRVYHTDNVPKNSLIAVKHDGKFGFIYSYRNFIYEEWEGNDNFCLENTSLGDGIVFGAEKMPNGTVYLLDVYQVRGVPALHSESILLNYLSSLKLPNHYKIQTYYKNLEGVPKESAECDGLIYHSVNDIVYKVKPVKTVDLLYENGYFKTRDKSIQTNQRLVNGRVYECDLNLQVIKERPDRFMSNTTEQLAEIMKL